MERCYNIKELKNNENVSYRNGFVMPIFAFLSDFYDSHDLLNLIETFSELHGSQILDFLGLTPDDYADLIRHSISENIGKGVSEMDILSLDPFLTQKIFSEFQITGTIYIRAKDIGCFEKDLDKSSGVGVFVEPYYDGDELTSFVSDFCGKNKLPVIAQLYDDLLKTGEINSTFNQTPIQYIENIGLLDRDLKILGGNYADKDDFSLISSYGAKMIICPYESLNFGRSCPNLQAMLNAGVNVEIASPIENDLFKEFEFISVVSRGLLSDESVLDLKEVSKLSISNKERISVKTYKNLEERLEKIKEKILCR